MNIEPDFWRGRRVLITGHTGFKGAWLTLWLQSLGAHVSGCSASVPSDPSLYALAHVADGIEEQTLDICDYEAVAAAFVATRPEVVFHLAAQPLVRRSFADPRGTFEVNVMGTVNVLEAVRACTGIEVLVVVTSDKCYDPSDPDRAHEEDDRLGGFDPYSSSKACAELVTSAYRDSFLSGEGATRVASARAGNVIGGGDWGAERLIPDLMRGALAGEHIRIRNPTAVRPWQHVLSALSGYLVLAQAAWGSPQFAGAWNFGPDEHDPQSVGWIVEQIAALWPQTLSWASAPGPHPHEARALRIDSTRARSALGWKPVWDVSQAIGAVVAWYGALAAHEDMRAITLAQVEAFGEA